MTGSWLPGDRLPNRVDIERLFGASRTTVQKALDSLARDGFVSAQQGSGTFVVEHPPHLCDYALVFPRDCSWSRFWLALQTTAREFSTRERRIRTYFSAADPDLPDNQLLLGDVEAHKLAGLMITWSRHEFEGTPVWENPGIPRVVLNDEEELTGAPMVELDYRSFFDQAIERLIKLGRKRIALLGLTGPERFNHFESCMQAHGLPVRPYWSHRFHKSYTQTARSLSHLLCQLEGEKRPDALIIADDNIVEPVLAGLLDANVSIGQDLLVIAHCNYPAPPLASVAPVIWLGFDCRELMATFLDIIDQQRRGQSPPPVTALRARFAEDTTPPWTAS